MPINRCGYIYTMEYYLVIRKNEIMPFTTARMDVEIIILSEEEKDKCNRYHLYMEAKIKMNLSTKQKQTHRQNRKHGCQGGRVVGEGQSGNLGLEDTNSYIWNG